MLYEVCCSSNNKDYVAQLRSDSPVDCNFHYECTTAKLGLSCLSHYKDRLCGLVIRVLGYRSEGPGSIPGTTRKKKVVGLEWGPLSLVSTTEELLDRKVAAPV
jgi:hypothetical protein